MTKIKRDLALILASNSKKDKKYKDIILKTIPFETRVAFATAEIRDKEKEILLKYGILDTGHGYADYFVTKEEIKE